MANEPDTIESLRAKLSEVNCESAERRIALKERDAKIAALEQRLAAVPSGAPESESEAIADDADAAPSSDLPAPAATFEPLTVAMMERDLALRGVTDETLKPLTLSDAARFLVETGGTAADAVTEWLPKTGASGSGSRPPVKVAVAAPASVGIDWPRYATDTTYREAHREQAIEESKQLAIAERRKL